LPLDPHTVDLRSTTRPPDGHEPNPSGSNRRAVLGALGILVVGLVLGFSIASIGNVDPEPRENAAPLVEGPTQRPLDASAVDTVSPGDVQSEPTSSPVPGVSGLEGVQIPAQAAGLEPLPAAGALAGPLTLVPGLDSGIALRLAATGTVSIVVSAPAAQVLDIPAGAARGFPLAAVADGLLYSPTDYALGAVAYWRPNGGTALPIPDEPSRTSFLSARDDVAVFLSAGEIVVRDMRTFSDVMRLDAAIDGVPVTQAWVSPDSHQLVLVTRDGRGRVLDLDDSQTVLVEFTTDLAPRGVTWTAPGQLAFIVATSTGQVVRAIDVATGGAVDVARLGGSTSWRLANAAGRS
jgi:hypothetical protein